MEVYGEFVKIIVSLIGLVVTYYIIPLLKIKAKEWSEKMTAEQRKELMIWSNIGVKIAESIYQEKGKGVLKKEYVIEFLNKNNIEFTEEQLNLVVDSIVALYNANDWSTDISEIVGEFK